MSHRRDFLRTAVGTSVVSLGATAPEFLCRAAWGQEESNDDRILVVIQLSGGNDGLNTVIPYGNDVYRSKRPTLAIGKDEVLAVNDDLGFHPSMSGIAEILEADKLSVIQNVGYANPNRSHFESMDIWHTCQRKNQTRSSGWLGRFIDQRSEQEQDSGAVHLGQEEKPLALASEKVQAIWIAS
ncbi:MAG: Twin-arginine translocation pathway signal sequence domain protein, partial [Pirellulaceae bacterium]